MVVRMKPTAILCILILGAAAFSIFYHYDVLPTGWYTSPSSQRAPQVSVPPATPSMQQEQAASQQQATTDEKIVYVYGAGLIARKDMAGIAYHHQDYLSSNRFATDSNGRLVGKNVPEPYGTTLDEIGTKNALQNDYSFTGKEQDDRLYYFGARYYDPRTARFISVDPVFKHTIQSYSYAANNPFKFTDPTGEDVQHFVFGLDPAYTYNIYYGFPAGTQNPPSEYRYFENLQTVINQMTGLPGGTLTFALPGVSPVWIIPTVLDPGHEDPDDTSDQDSDESGGRRSYDEGEGGPYDHGNLRPYTRGGQSASQFMFPAGRTRVFDVQGRLVLDIESGSTLWDEGKQLASGHYFYRGEDEGGTRTTGRLFVSESKEVLKLHKIGTIVPSPIGQVPASLMETILQQAEQQPLELRAWRK